MRIKFTNFTFDSRRRELMGDGRAIALTPKAFLLLEALITAAPDPMSKEEIYDRLWPDVFVETGNLHNLISEIRTALGDDDHAMIRTMHRIGYAFAVPFVRDESSAPRLQIGDEFIELQQGETIIGRERLGTPDASRRHARITVSGTKITVEDLGSKNGTFVGGHRIEGPTVVHDHDEIVFGRTRAIVQVIDVGASTVTAGPVVSGNRGSTPDR